MVLNPKGNATRYICPNGVYSYFKKTLSKEKQKGHTPRLQGNMRIFATSWQCRHDMAKISGGAWNYPYYLVVLWDVFFFLPLFKVAVYRCVKHSQELLLIKWCLPSFEDGGWTLPCPPPPKKKKKQTKKQTNRKQTNKEKGGKNGKLEQETTAWTGERCDKRDLWGVIEKVGTEGLLTAAQYQALWTNAMKANSTQQSVDPKCRQRHKEITANHIVHECLSRKTWLGMHWKLFWYFRIKTSPDIAHNTPDRLFMLDKK